MDHEMWVSVNDFPRYAVSWCGEVKNMTTGRLLRQSTDKNGYKRVMLYEGGNCKRIMVHRLVCEAFHGLTGGKLEVNHIDGIKDNNNADNLEWCTTKQNQQHRRLVLGKRNDRRVVRVEDGTEYPSLLIAAKENRSYIPNIVRACKNKSTAAGYHWTYI